MHHQNSPDNPDARRVPLALAILAALAACLVPILTNIWAIHHFGVNIPFADDWSVTFLLEKYVAGTLTFSDLFRPHNEHRVVFSRAILLFLAPYTRFDIPIILYSTQGFLFISLLVLFAQIKKRIPAVVAYLWFVPIPFILLGPRQTPTFLDQADMLANFFVPIFSLVTFHFLDVLPEVEDNLPATILPVGAAITAGTIASFSLAAGLCVWPAGLLHLLLARATLQRKIALVAVWGAAGVVEIVAFFWNWHTSPAGSLNPLARPFAIFIELAKGPGFALFHRPEEAVFTGVLMSATIVVVLLLLVKNGRLADNAFWLALLAFAFCCMGMITVGRLDLYATDVLKEERYAPIVVLVVIALYALLVDNVRHKGYGASTTPFLLCALLVFVSLGAWNSAVRIFSYRYGERFAFELKASEKRGSAFYLYAYERKDPEQYYLIGVPGPTTLGVNVPFLKQQEVSVFHDLKNQFEEVTAQAPLAALAPLSATTDFTLSAPYLFHRGDEPFFITNGWATDRAADAPASSVYVQIDERLYPTLYGTPRKMKKIDDKTNLPLLFSGFALAVPSSEFERKAGEHTLSLKIVTQDGHAYYQTPPQPFFVVDGDERTGGLLPALSAMTPISSDYYFFAVDALQRSHTGGEQQEQQIVLSPGEEYVTISGWAIDKQADNLAGGVYLDIDGKLYPAAYGYPREDVADALGNTAYRACGFRREIPAAALGMGPHTLSVRVLTHDQTHYYAPPTTVSFSLVKDAARMKRQ